MATVNIYPSSATVYDGWNNIANIGNNSNYASSVNTTYGLHQDFTVKFSTDTINAYVPSGATISNVTVKIIAKLSDTGTGTVDTIGYAVSGASLIEIDTSYSFGTSWTTITHSLGNVNPRDMQLGFLFTNNRFGIRQFHVQQVYIVVTYTPPSYYLDLNGWLDGASNGGISPQGTADIYINGSKVSEDISDYYQQHPSGTTYEIKDIKAKSGYEYVGVKSGSLSGTITAATTVVLEFRTKPLSTYTVNFRNADGSVLQTKTVNSGAAVGTLPTPTRNGYTFAGWLPCAPARTMQNQVLDSMIYTGQSNSFNALLQSYKYTDKIAVHVEAYMTNWEEIKTLNAQILSCTEGGGWGLGYQANTNGKGAELRAGGAYKGIDFGFGTAGVFTNGQWYTFDITFNAGTFEAYVNGVKKGTQSMGGTTIQYGSTNTIFVGAEAHNNTTTPANGYFKGIISNVFIANQGTRLAPITSSTVITGNTDYYPIWRKEKLPEILSVEIAPNPATTGQGLTIKVKTN